MKRITFLHLFFFIVCSTVFAQTDEFTYQGRLVASGSPVNTAHDFEFRLCATESDCESALQVKRRLNVPLSNGAFSVKLDFDRAHFGGEERWLHIGVRPAGGTSFVTLSPSQKVTSSPYAITSRSAAELGGVPANQFVQTNDSRLSDARSPLPNSSNYIQNSTSPQSDSNFAISGNGEIGNNLRVGNSADVSGSLRVGASITSTGNISTTANFTANSISATSLSTSSASVTNNISIGGNGLIGGSLGVGTAPATKLHVSGTGIIRTRINSDSNSGVALTLNNQPGWSIATVSGGQFQIFNDSIGANAVWIDSSNNRVGIATTSPQDQLDVNGALRVSSLGAPGMTPLCHNGSNQIATCLSSVADKALLEQQQEQIALQQKRLDVQELFLKRLQSEVDALRSLVNSGQRP